jgi:AhpD family alkylhydroperoxidase
MTPRLDPLALSPRIMEAMEVLEKSVRESGLEHSLVELVKTRASQINGCAFCIHMHTRDARRAGESEARLYLLDAWRESPLYSDRERAALAWTEALTRLAVAHPDEDAYVALQAQFTDKEIVDLTMLIATINGWNRIAIASGLVHPVDAEHAAA